MQVCSPLACPPSSPSCKDYDDDISDLRQKYDNLSSVVASLQAKIDAGSVITSLDPISNGVVMTLSDGQTYTITNGKDGARGEKGDKGEKGDTGEKGQDGIYYSIGTDGYWYADGVKTDVKAIGEDGIQGPKGDKGDKGDSGKDGATWTIGDDGYWCLDGAATTFKATGSDGKNAGEWTIGSDGYWYYNGEATDRKAVGQDGKNGTDTTIVLHGDYYVPNDTTLTFDRYVWNSSTGRYDVIPTSIPFTARGTITAVKDADRLTLYGVTDAGGAESAPIVISLAAPVSSASIVSGSSMSFLTAFTQSSTFGSVYADQPIRFFGSTQSMTADILVLVNPSSAVLKADNVHLVNTAGKETDAVVCTGAKRYTGVDTRAVQSNIWQLTFSLKPGLSESEFRSVTGTGGSHILYAVSIRDENSTDADSRVTTDYSITLNSDNLQYSGPYNVNGVSVAGIHNRYLATEDSTSTTGIEELVWAKNSSSSGNRQSVNRPGSSYTNAEKDNRQSEPLPDITTGQPLKITWPSSSSVKGFYVLLDRNFAIEDGGSELDTWNSYSYENVGIVDSGGTVITKAHMFTGNEGTIRINTLSGNTSDIIGFRVYAVNADGTLVDPDGAAFYVRVSSN